jgi:predicted metal-dependent hydrolase
VVTGVAGGDEAAGLPPFTVRQSGRARHVRLIVTGQGQLVVVVPRHFDRRRIPAILVGKRAWIERAQERAAVRRAATGTAAGSAGLPGSIALPAISEERRVEYRPASPLSQKLRAVVRETSDGSLVVTGPADDEEVYRRALIEWLRSRARRFLLVRLQELAQTHGLPFQQATIRHQRTRWGSCSPRGTISLNLRLLFLRPEIVDHVLLHELCHTRELNHSKRFWALVQAHDPECISHRREAREAWCSLPEWIHPQGSGHWG